MQALPRFPAAVRSLLVQATVVLVCDAAFWWVAAAALLLVADVFRAAVPAPRAFVALHAGSCFVATLLIRWCTRREGLLARLGVSRAGAMAGSLIMATVCTTIGTAAADIRLGLPPAATPRAYLVAMFIVHLALLATWCLIHFGQRLLREAAVAVRRTREAEAQTLGHLRSRLDPRFLLSALGAVAASRDDPRAIDTVSRALANYLRFIVEPSAPLEPLGRELDAVAEYLTVQRVMRGDDLRATIECDPAIRAIPVLPLLIQPLVENAVMCGESPGEPLQILVRAARDGDELVIEVGNTGRRLQLDQAEPSRSTLQSLRRRLEFWSGPGATLTTWEEVGWAWVTMRVRLESRYAAPASVAAGPC